MPVKFTDRFPAHETLRAAYKSAFKTSVIEPAYLDLVFNLAANIHGMQTDHPVLVGISGGQGSGKSTLARAVAETLEMYFETDVAVLSLDDFYLTRAERQLLAAQVHPLLRTRGVPGTHDIELMQDAIDQLLAGGGVSVPVFDKARDDRSESSRYLPGANVLICEGWCWGATPEPPARLLAAVNDLERQQDARGEWRRYVNRQLESCQNLFHTDANIFLKVPSMEAVFRWRWQQEEALNGRGMSRNEVRAFIGYYERLTRWMLEDMPPRVHACISLREDHGIAEVSFR